MDAVAHDKSKRQVIDPFKIEVSGELLVTEDLPECVTDMMIGLCKTYTGRLTHKHDNCQVFLQLNREWRANG